MSIPDLSLGTGRFIPRHELSMRASKGGGPGGQHVNKTSTRVEVRWNLKETGALSEEERSRIMRRLGPRIDARGNIRVVSNFSRSQHANRERAESRLAELIRGALAVRRPRKKTAPGKTAVERRLKEKKQHSEKKKARRINTDE